MVTAASGSSSSSSAQTSAASTYTVGGDVTGLSGTGLVLEINGGQDLQVATNGPVTFPTALASGSSYIVTVKSQPSGYREICGVTNGSGTVAGPSAIITVVSVTVMPYGIDPVTGALTPIGTGTQVASNGAALTADPSGRFLYMVNGGYTVNDRVQALAVDQSSGTVVTLGSPNLTSGSPVAILCDRSGQFVYVANAGSTGPGPASPDLVAFEVSTQPASAGQLVPSGAGAFESPNFLNTSMAVIE